MKRTLTIVLVLVALTIGAQGQSYKSAIGLRGGDPFGVTFKTFLNSTNAIELIAGTGYWGHSFTVTGFYQWQYPTDWAPNLDWFIGPGAHVGLWGRHYTSTGLLVGIDGIIGLEYTLDDFPLNFGFGVGPTFHFIGAGWYHWNGGFAIRYVF